MLKATQVNISTNIYFTPFWQLESKEVYFLAVPESEEKEQELNYDYVFPRYTLERQSIIIS
ncbi:MAG: hypothetical protein K6U11_06965 [bacterium]|nr:hypothetical protein [bacterium]